jgi:hypothetical protein
MSFRPEAFATLMRLPVRPSALILLVVLGSMGCSREYIPNTDVENTDLNRKVIHFCEEYRHAVERRNTALLLKMADPSYHEDGGNADATDDLDYAGLRDYLEGKFGDTKAIRYEIRYRRVGKGRGNEIYVDYTYSASYKLGTAEGEIWRRTVADNRLELVPHGETYRVVAGM